MRRGGGFPHGAGARAGGAGKQLARYAKERYFCNAQLPQRGVEKYCLLSPEAGTLLRRAAEHFHISKRAYGRIRKVARTLADLGGRETIEVGDVAQAIQREPRRPVLEVTPRDRGNNDACSGFPRRSFRRPVRRLLDTDAPRAPCGRILPQAGSRPPAQANRRLPASTAKRRWTTCAQGWTDWRYALPGTTGRIPPLLNCIDDPPYVLYAMGDVSVLSRPSVAMVERATPADTGVTWPAAWPKGLGRAG